MNNNNDLNLHSMTKLSGWLRYWLFMFSMSKILKIFVMIYICYLLDGRSVLEKYFVEVSKTTRGRRPRDVFETETKYFSVRTELNGK